MLSLWPSQIILPIDFELPGGIESPEVAMFPAFVRSRLLRHLEAVVPSEGDPRLTPLVEETCTCTDGAASPHFSVVDEWSVQVRACVLEAVSALLVGYRDFLTVTRIAGKSQYASENADRVIINVVDVVLPSIGSSPLVSPSPLHPAARSPAAAQCIFRVEFDRAGELHCSSL